MKAHVERSLPLAEGGQAHRFLETRPKGKLVLAV